jgi:hypothetical protein
MVASWTHAYVSRNDATATCVRHPCKEILSVAVYSKYLSLILPTQARRVEEKAERDNYKNWIAFQLDSFAQEGRAFLELPPCDSVHRIIAKDEVVVPPLIG